MPCSVIEQSGGGREEEKTIILQISRGIANLRDVCVRVCACVCVCVCVCAGAQSSLTLAGRFFTTAPPGRDVLISSSRGGGFSEAGHH